MQTTNFFLLGQLLLLVAPNASVVKAASMTSSTFEDSPAASAYKGDPIKLDFVSSPSWGWTMEEILSLKSVVVRLGNGAVDFQPNFEILRGSYSLFDCRPGEEDTEPKILSDNCEKHCMNNGRYCDEMFAIETAHEKIPRRKRQHFKQVQGHSLVEESARRVCVWQMYGQFNLITYFQYHEAMKATGCDALLQQDCIEQAMAVASIDYSSINKCVQGGRGLGPTVQGSSPVLESQFHHEHILSKDAPSLFVNGVDMEDYASTDKALRLVCDAFPEDQRKPAVCDFCINYCINQSSEINDDTCLWELKCGDGSSFSDYLVSMGTTEKEVLKQAQASTSSSFSSAGGLAATFLAMVLSAGLLMLAVMGIRVWRTKVIIERYVREQEELSMANHRDPAFFPDENELDLDLEPALQYSDHIAAPASSRGPSRSTFLPQLT